MDFRKMNIFYDDKSDLLYIRFSEEKQEVVNKRVSEDVVLDIGKKGKIVGIEFLNASNHIHLENLLPVKYSLRKKAS